MLRSRFKCIINKDYKDYVRHTECNIVKNPKLFWNFTLNMKKENSNFPHNTIYNNLSDSQGLKIAELFFSFFNQSIQKIQDTRILIVC